VSATVAWIGLGEMGLPMAGNLWAAGHRVLGFDIDADRLAAAGEAGIEPAASAAAAAEGADVLVTMLRTGAQTEELIGGLAEGLPDGKELDVVVMSTADPALLSRLAESTAGRMTIVDAPVSGGVVGAENGTLAIMVGGPPDARDRVRPLFEVMGASIFELGDLAGAGQAAKFANQVMMSAAIAGTLEALELARAYEIDVETVRRAVAAGTGQSWPLDHWDWMRSLWEGYFPGNALDILIKDLRAVLSAGDERAVALPGTALALERLLAERDRPADQVSRK
jgi:3-hydroxyisobutyrate dehydrogenase-like beta-hydroxyacid dehydrogenase